MMGATIATRHHITEISLFMTLDLHRSPLITMEVLLETLCIFHLRKWKTDSLMLSGLGSVPNIPHPWYTVS